MRKKSFSNVGRKARIVKLVVILSIIILFVIAFMIYAAMRPAVTGNVVILYEDGGQEAKGKAVVFVADSRQRDISADIEMIPLPDEGGSHTYISTRQAAAIAAHEDAGMFFGRFIRSLMPGSVSREDGLSAKMPQDGAGISQKKADMVIRPDDSIITEVEVRGLLYDENQPVEIFMEDLSAGRIGKKDSVQAYAIDPSRMDFSDAMITVNAKGNSLFKCDTWNFSEQLCSGGWKLFRQDLVPGEDYKVSISPHDPAFYEMMITRCWAEDSSSTSPGTWANACDNAYPGTALSFDDASYEIHRTRKQGGSIYWAGIRINSSNSSISDCRQIDDVQFCYKWWAATATLASCDISVDADSGTSYSAVTTACPGAVAESGSIICINVTAAESWACQDFFGTGATGAIAKSELIYGGATNGYYDITWDAFYFNVTYSLDNPPYWSGNITNVVSVYDNVRQSRFNITWQDDVAVDTVFFESNFSVSSGLNYSMADFGAGIYSYSHIFPAGSFYWRSFANDSRGRWNATDTWHFDISRADPEIALSASPSWVVNYGTFSNVSCNDSSDGQSGIGFYKDGILLGGFSDEGIFAAGQYGYVCNCSQTENYTAGSQAFILNVTRAEGRIFLYLNKSRINRTIQNNTWINISASLEWGIGNITVYKNHTSIHDGPSPSDDLILFDAPGHYNITASYDGNENYTSDSETWWINVTLTAPPDYPPTWRDNLTDLVLVYQPGAFSSFNITWQDDHDVDHVFLESNYSALSGKNYSMTSLAQDRYTHSAILPAGNFYWTSYANDSAGNWSKSVVWEFEILSADPGLAIDSSPLWDVRFGTETNVSCSHASAESLPILHLDGSPLGLLYDLRSLGVGIYNYTCNISQTENYTSGSVSDILTVSKAEGDISLYLNGSISNLTVIIYGQVNISAELEDGDGNIQVYKNSTLLYDGASPSKNIIAFNELGRYNITASYQGDENYTSDTQTLWVDVIPIPPPSDAVMITSCAAETAAVAPGSWASPCDNTYPGYALHRDDSVYEVHQVRKLGGTSYWAGLRINSSNTSITDCGEIVSVDLCYKWWSATADVGSCYIAVDNDDGLSYANVTTACPGTGIEAGGISCIDVSALDDWSCGNFFGPASTGAMVKSELVSTSAINGYHDITWDALYYDVAYHINSPPYWSENKTRIVSIFSSMVSSAFNITWKDDYSIDSVFFESNFTGQRKNHTMVNITPDIYNFSKVLPAGSFYWRSHANDSFGIWSVSSTWQFVIQKAQGAISLYLDGSQQNITIGYGQTVNISSVLDEGSGSIQVSIEGLLIHDGPSPSENLTVFEGLGSYNVTSIYSGNQNYTLGSKTFWIYVLDDVMPSVWINISQNNTVVGDDTPSVGFNFSDEKATSANCTLLINSSQYGHASGLANNTPYVLEANSSLVDSNYSIFVRCTEDNGNTADSGVIFLVVDTRSPAVLDLSPAPGAQFGYSDSVNITADVTDLTAVDKVYANISWPGGSAMQQLFDTASDDIFWSEFFNTFALGRYNITMIANDTQGLINDSESTYFIVGDNTPPDVRDIDPSLGSPYAQATVVNITANVTDNYTIDKVFAKISTASASQLVEMTDDDLDSIFNCSFSQTSAVGRYNVTIIANDTYGNRNDSEGTYFMILDSTPPIVSIDVSLNNTYTDDPRPYIIFNFTDSDSLTADCTLLIDGIGYNLTPGVLNSTPSGLLSNESISDGNHTVMISCVDESANPGISSGIFLFIDTTPPNVTLIAPGPGDLFDIGTVVAISALISDAGIMDKVYANISWPGGSQSMQLLDEDTDDVYKVNFTGAVVIGRYNVTVYANDSLGNINSTEKTWFDATVFSDINISLKSPANNTGDNDGTIIFTFNVSSRYNLSRCSLVIDENPVLENLTINASLEQNFIFYYMDAGKYFWEIRCQDMYGGTNFSTGRTFSVIPTTNFLIGTTDLSQVSISEVSGLSLGNSYGAIYFWDDVDLSSGPDIDASLEISHNHLALDSVAVPQLNKSSAISLYGLPYDFTPAILKDGSICAQPVCDGIDYDLGILSFNSSSFSSYSSTANSQLEIFDQADELGGSITAYPDQDIWFYANFSNTTTGEPIFGPGAGCSASFEEDQVIYGMAFSPASSLYELSYIISEAGTLRWNISCDAASIGYEIISAQDDIIVENIPDGFMTGHCTAEYIDRGPDFRAGYLNRGDTVRFYCEPGYDIAAGEEFEITILPKLGLPASATITSPDVITDRYEVIYS